MSSVWPRDALTGDRGRAYVLALADLPADDVSGAVEELVREPWQSAPPPSAVRERALRIGARRPPVSLEAPPAPGRLPEGVTVTGAWKRLGAFLLDCLLAVLTLGIGYLIWSIVVWGRGQTPAKRLLGMYVVRRVGPAGPRPAGRGLMAARQVAIMWVLGNLTNGLFLVVGGLFVPFREDRRALWDLMVDTVVVDDPGAVLRARELARQAAEEDG